MSDLPDGWSVAPLGELCRIELGRTPARANARCWDNEKSTSNVWLSISDMPSSLHAVATDSREYVSDAAADEMKLVPEGTLLASFKLTLGRLCYAGRDLYTNEAIAALLDLDRERLSKEYLYWYLTFFDWDAAAEGDEKVKGKTLNKAKLKILPIYIPPLDEQKRIVAVLDQAFAALDRARANAEANLADAQTLFETEVRLQFETAGSSAGFLPFDSVCEPLTPRVKLKRQDYLEEGQYPVVSQEADLISGYWDDPTAVMDVSGPVVVFGDHTCCLKLVDFDFVVGADGTKILQPVEGVAAKYLYYGLRSQPIQQSGYARHFKLLRETVLPDLPTAEQDRITDHLDQLDARCLELRSSYEAALIDLTTLRQSLLQAAFSGQLS